MTSDRPIGQPAPERGFFLAAALALSSVIPLLGFPVYFRTDDVYWLAWAREHGNPLAAFGPAGSLFGYYRPVPTLAWWLLYRLFGFQPAGYQVALGVVAVLSMLPLFRIGERLSGRPWGGFLAVCFLQAGFFTIQYYVYWFSALTFGLEMLFLLLALDAFLSGASPPARPAAFVACAVLAGLSKQPALLIIPVVTLAALAAGDGLGRRRVVWAAGIVLGSGLLLLATPFVASQPGELSRMGLTRLAGFGLERAQFYGRAVLSSPAGPAALAVALGGWAVRVAQGGRAGGETGERPAAQAPGIAAWLATAVGLVAGLLLRFVSPAAAWLLWTLVLVAAAVAVPASRPWVAGFCVPLVALLGVEVHVGTYLLEPAAILAPALVLWSAPLLAAPADRISREVAVRLPPPARLLIPLLAGAAVVAVAYNHLPAVRTMRDTRATFRLAVEALVAGAPRGATVGAFTYEELGQSAAGIRARPLAQRVEQQKTMTPDQLQLFLKLRGRADLKVVPVGEALSVRGPCWLVATSPGERERIRDLPAARQIAGFERGGAAAALFELGGREGPP